MILVHSTRTAGTRSSAAQEAEDDPHREDISVFPLAIPLIVGPGSLATVLLCTAGDVFTVAAVLGMLLVALSLTLASLLLALRVMSILTRTDADVFSRVLGVLLAVQFVLDGIKQSSALG